MRMKNDDETPPTMHPTPAGQPPNALDRTGIHLVQTSTGVPRQSKDGKACNSST